MSTTFCNSLLYKLRNTSSQSDQNESCHTWKCHSCCSTLQVLCNISSRAWALHLLPQMGPVSVLLLLNHTKRSHKDVYIYLFRWNRLLKLFSFLTCKLRMHFAHHSLFTHTACSCGNLREVTQVSLFFFLKRSLLSLPPHSPPTWLYMHVQWALWNIHSVLQHHYLLQLPFTFLFQCIHESL